MNPRVEKVSDFVDGTGFLGDKGSWTKPFEVAYQHKAGIAETAYKKLD